jgi:hypothetical protein
VETSISGGLSRGATHNLLRASTPMRRHLPSWPSTDVELQPEMHDRLGNLWADAADDALGTHQPGGRHSPDEVLSHLGVHSWNARDVYDCDLGTRLYNMVEKIFHHRLCALAVQGANQRKGQDLVPQLHHRSREFEQLVA